MLPDREPMPIRYPDLRNHSSEGYERYPQFLEIEKRTREILGRIPVDRAVEIARIVNSNWSPDSPHTTHIPGVVIFTREGENPQEVYGKLLEVLKRPFGETIANTPEDSEKINQLRQMLADMGFDEGTFVPSLMRMHMIRTAGGDPAASFEIYEDLGRDFPVHALSWNILLRNQFGGNELFFASWPNERYQMNYILNRTQQAALDHEKRDGRRRLVGEDVAAYIARQIRLAQEALPETITPEDFFDEASKLLALGLREYRTEAYRVRRILREDSIS